MTQYEIQLHRFFRDPNDFTEVTGEHSTLYLLRRDILTCLGFDATSNEEIKHEAKFAGALAIFAGIDLVAKFLYSDDDKITVSKRFKDFLKQYFDDRYNEELYQLRNALIHSYGLYSERKFTENKIKIVEIYRFTLSWCDGVLVQKTGAEHYRVDLKLLHESFNRSIDLYKEDLDQSDDLQKIFVEMYKKYGQISIQRSL